jgi:hypothetical protein
MGFNLDKFSASSFEPKKGKVSVPALADFFGESEEAIWEVRGLNASELYKAMDAGNKQASLEAVVNAIADKKEQAAVIRSALGLSNDTPGEIAKRMEMLVMGSVSPQITLPVAVKLAETFPIEFMVITNEITDLTGKGSDLVKPNAASQKAKK